MKLLKIAKHGGKIYMVVDHLPEMLYRQVRADVGSYKPQGESRYVAISDLASLQRCGVYMGYEMLETTLNTLLDEYYTRDKVYTYDEVDAWVQLQHEWYDIYIHGKKIPFMMNRIGDVVTRETKEKVHAMHRIMLRANSVITLFKIEYLQDGRKIQLEDTFDNVFNASVRRGKDE